MLSREIFAVRSTDTTGFDRKFACQRWDAAKSRIGGADYDRWYHQLPRFVRLVMHSLHCLSCGVLRQKLLDRWKDIGSMPWDFSTKTPLPSRKACSSETQRVQQHPHLSQYLYACCTPCCTSSLHSVFATCFWSYCRNTTCLVDQYTRASADMETKTQAPRLALSYYNSYQFLESIKSVWNRQFRPNWSAVGMERCGNDGSEKGVTESVFRTTYTPPFSTLSSRQSSRALPYGLETPEGQMTTNHEHFPQFSRLPKEIQIRIFELSLQAPHVKSRIIRRIHTPRNAHLLPSTCTYKFSVPPALQVCSLYRSIALPFYPSLVPGTLYPVYFNAQVDSAWDTLAPAKSSTRSRKHITQQPERPRTSYWK